MRRISVITVGQLKVNMAGKVRKVVTIVAFEQLLILIREYSRGLSNSSCYFDKRSYQGRVKFFSDS
jgi:hypothetical protein